MQATKSYDDSVENISLIKVYLSQAYGLDMDDLVKENIEYSTHIIPCMSVYEPVHESYATLVLTFKQGIDLQYYNIIYDPNINFEKNVLKFDLSSMSSNVSNYNVLAIVPGLAAALCFST